MSAATSSRNARRRSSAIDSNAGGSMAGLSVVTEACCVPALLSIVGQRTTAAPGAPVRTSQETRKRGTQEERMLDLEELTGRVIGAAIEVHRTLGPGFLEVGLRSRAHSRDAAS